MKISIITFFDNGNYGSELQSLALFRYLTDRGNDVTLCHIKAQNKLIRIIEVVCDRIALSFQTAFDKEMKQYLNDRIVNSSKQRSISPELKHYIHTFVSNHITSKRISRWNIPNKQFDVYVCGSDQIWSALKLPISPSSFLGKVSPQRKIAYAPSFGLDCLPCYFIKRVRKDISDFKYLSVRESSAKLALKEHMNLDAIQALDPTMLVGVDFWNQLLTEEGKKSIEKKYVLCYFLGEMSESIISSINAFSDGMDVIVLPYEEDSLKVLNGKFVLADPLDFVNLIKHATYVLTDSFHGSLFSILYKKQFVVTKRSHVGLVAQTSRITSLLTLFGLERRCCEKDPEMLDVLKAPIDYKFADEILFKEQLKSKTFLDNALNEIKSQLKI